MNYDDLWNNLYDIADEWADVLTRPAPTTADRLPTAARLRDWARFASPLNRRYDDRRDHGPGKPSVAVVACRLARRIERRDYPAEAEVWALHDRFDRMG